MKEKDTTGARLAALTLLAGLLFTPPLLTLFDRPLPGGLSGLSWYLFAAWGGVIVLAAWLLEQPHEE